MGSIIPRKGKDGSQSFKAEVRKKGYLYATQTFPRLTDAKQWIQDIESSMRSGRFVIRKGRASEEAQVIRSAVLSDRTVQARGRPYALSDLTPQALSDIKRSFLKQKNKQGKLRSPQTWNRYQSTGMQSSRPTSNLKLSRFGGKEIPLT